MKFNCYSLYHIVWKFVWLLKMSLPYSGGSSVSVNIKCWSSFKHIKVFVDTVYNLIILWQSLTDRFRRGSNLVTDPCHSWSQYSQASIPSRDLDTNSCHLIQFSLEMWSIKIYPEHSQFLSPFNLESIPRGFCSASTLLLINLNWEASQLRIFSQSSLFSDVLIKFVKSFVVLLL